MGFWTWVLTVLGGLLVLVILFFVAAEMWLRRRARQDEQELASDPGRLQRFAEARDVTALLAALHSPSDDVSGQAAAVLAPLKEPAITEALLACYFNNPRPVRTIYADALALRPASEVVPSALEKLGSRREPLAIELLRRFDIPAAREAVDRFDSAREQAEAAVAKRNAIIARQLSAAAESQRTTLRFALPIETGGGQVASKLIGGLLSGGVGAVAPNTYSADDLVKLPAECVFCGCAPGKTDRWAKCQFQLASAGWGVVGINTAGEVFLTYKVCADCGGHDEKVQAIVLAIDKAGAPALVLQVGVLNPEIAAEIRNLNPQA
jgi:hypothetical protein